MAYVDAENANVILPRWLK